MPINIVGRRWLRSVVLTIGLSLAPVVEAQEPQAWIIQTDLDPLLPLTILIPVEGTGSSSVTALLPIGASGAMFELFADGSAWDPEGPYGPLDTKFINAYSPEASVNIVSEDPYVRNPGSGSYVRRTRADRPFSVDVQVADLVEGSLNPAEQSVIFTVGGRNYDMATYSGLGQTSYTLSEQDLGNGDFSLPPYDMGLAAGCGEQSYVIDRYADPADGVPRTTLVQPKIEIWPLAATSLSLSPSDETQNIVGQVFTDKIPPLFLTMKHLYPDSSTYAQIYPGTEVLGTVGQIISGTERTFLTNVPQDVAVMMDNLSLYADADGIYTFEVITETPFFVRAPERLMHVTFEVDRVILVRGQLSSGEDTDP